MIPISVAALQRYREETLTNHAAHLAMNAVTANGIGKSSIDIEALKNNVHEYSVSLKTGEITSQEQSGRCWMFAALNAMRQELISSLNLESFEFSQAYPLFWDKLEKSNYFLENILSTLEEKTDGRIISFLLSAPLNDGGQFDMFAGLIEKYGLVPKSAMPETVCSSATAEMDKYLTLKLREYACKLRNAHRKGESVESLRAQKEDMLSTIYRMLTICLGFPPETVDFIVRDKNDQLIRDEGLTPLAFYEKYVGWDLNDYVSLINAPTEDKPYGHAYTVRFLGSVYEARPVKYLNLPIAELKQAAIRQLQDNKSVWFGCDVGQRHVRDLGIMDTDSVAVDKLFGTEFPMTKEERLNYGESLMTHAMVLQGVHLNEEGQPVRWRVENSWGKDKGKNGYYLMSDDWFNEYTYQIVVNKKYLSPEQLTQYEGEVKVLEPWDPMGSLAL
ncbi:MAG: C1 family peptidase [Clostridiales bacterium]|nr:C1 family peptidase [Clostridiales bacterium]